tara:strand:- start:1098 stop:2240 length:1143 start_codon:yes stop_codon:yes gene_type:complete
MRLIQLKNIQLLKNIFFFKTNFLQSIFILIIRLITLGVYFNFKKANKKISFKNTKNKNLFILDLRDAKLNLHLFSILMQFFLDMRQKYKKFLILTNLHTYTVVPSRPYSEEFNSLCNFLKKNLKINFITSGVYKSTNLKNANFIKISFIEGMFWKNNSKWSDPLNTKDIFLNKFKFKSKQIDLKLFYKKKNYSELEKKLKKTFNLVFYPTYDLDQKFEDNKLRKRGVISKKNFQKLNNFYNELNSELERRKISDFRIILLNKKSISWSKSKFVFDLRDFEKYKINFPEILSLVNSSCQWTLGSEGTLMSYLLLLKKPKHIIYVDNSHWPNIHTADGHAVPFCYKDLNYVNYKFKPKTYIPDTKDTLKKIFIDYKKFKNGL